MRTESLLVPEPPAGAAPQLSKPHRCAVVGGGIAGVAAATIMAERGAEVTLIEREPHLGGRASAWTDELACGTKFEMERGFHAFFRQYYNLRALLRRVDPDLSLLEPMADYPILSADGLSESFSGLPQTPPFNVIALTRRTKTLPLRDLLRVNARAAMAMLTFDSERTYDKFDDMSAGDYLDSLGFPDVARRMLFDVFAHSFFNPEKGMSAAELLMMFHFYFMGNPEGLIFDVLSVPFSTGLWQPFGSYLSDLGADVQLSRAVDRIEVVGDTHEPREYVVVAGDERVEADSLVLAVTVPALKNIVAASPQLGHQAFRDRIGSLDITLPFAVWRLWLDRPTDPSRAPFAGTTGVGLLDNISLYHLLEDESRDWAAQTGGAVVELHAYAVPENTSEDEIRADLLAALHNVYPETAHAGVIEERYFLRRDCPAFAPGSNRQRPGVTTGVAGLMLAGDFVRLDIPSALMERAATSGMLAANTILAEHGVAPEPLESVPRLGLFSRGRRKRRN